MPRKRIIKKNFWLSEEEDLKLKNYVKQTGKKESELFRNFINGNPIKEKPQEEFYETIKEFRMLSRSLSKLITIADNNDLDIDHIKKIITETDDFILDMKRNFLL